MNKLSAISAGISIIIGEISPTYFSLELRPPLEFSLGFVAIEVSLWRYSEVLPEVFPVFDHTETIVGEISPTYASFQTSLWKCVSPVSSLTGSLPSRSLFGAVANDYRKSLQHPIVQKLLLGRSLPHTLTFQTSLEMRPPREFSLGFVAIEVSFKRCSNSPVFDRTETIVGEISPTYASFPDVSLEMRPPREFSLGFVAIRVSLWRCSELLPGVSPVLDRTKTILEEISPTHASLSDVSLKMRPPREFSLEFVAIEVFLWRCSELLPEVSAVFNCTEAIVVEISPTYASLPEVSLETRPLREFSLGFAAIEVSLWRCSELLREASPVLDCTETIVGEIPPTHASLPEVSLEMRPPREFSLEFVAIEVSLWRCSELLLEVSPVFDHTEAILGKISPTYASLPDVSLEMRPPRKFSLGFVAIEVFLWCCSELLPEISSVFDV